MPKTHGSQTADKARRKMEEYSRLKSQTLEAGRRLAELYDAASAIPGFSKSVIRDGLKICQKIQAEISREKARIAVVGPIKSGKSTFINCLLGADHLKRGAGVVTSIVTRINRGPKLRAELFFKSIQEVNSDIHQALSLFPDFTERNTEKGFDLANDADRDALSNALSTLERGRLISHGAKDPQSLLLTLYLNGYDRAREYLESGRQLVVFEGKAFFEHRRFSGDDALAVFLKGILLYVDKEPLRPDIEIADCQGSDSPNPFHLAMIQDYLLVAHFIIYVISSRTGLRRADIRFLSLIRKMGLEGQILFVLNTDFSEHDSLKDLNQLKKRVTEEISLLRPDPEVFCFSALFHLFSETSESISPSDADRLDMWRKRQELKDYSQRQREAFENILQNRLSRQREELLLGNHLERLKVSVDALSKTGAIQKDIINRNSTDAEEMIRGLREHRERLEKAQNLAGATMEGAAIDIRKEIKMETDRLFDKGPEGLLGKVNQFIRSYNVAHGDYAGRFAESGFNRTIYRVYQDFKKDLDTYIAETIIPEVIRFAMEMEARLARRLEEHALPFGGMVADALDRYNRILASHGISEIQPAQLPPLGRSDTGALKSDAGIRLPALGSVMRYTARMKTESAFRFGIYKMARKIIDLIKRRTTSAKTEEAKALSDAVNIIRKNMLEAMAFNFKDYRENVKFQYLFKMVDAAATDTVNRLGERLRAYGSDLSATVLAVDQSKSDKDRITKQLEDLDLDLKHLRGDISDIKENIMAPDAG